MTGREDGYRAGDSRRWKSGASAAAAAEDDDERRLITRGRDETQAAALGPARLKMWAAWRGPARTEKEERERASFVIPDARP